MVDPGNLTQESGVCRSSDGTLLILEGSGSMTDPSDVTCPRCREVKLALTSRKVPKLEDKPKLPGAEATSITIQPVLVRHLFFSPIFELIFPDVIFFNFL